MKFTKQINSDISDSEKESVKDESDDSVDEEANFENEDSTENAAGQREVNFKNIAKEEDITQHQSLGEDIKKIVLEKIKKRSTKQLVDEAIKQLNERAGSSAEAIRKFILHDNPQMVDSRLKFQIKRYIKNCLIDGTMVQIKRSFKLTNKHDMKKKEIDKQKLKAKKDKQKEKDKTKKEKKKLQNKAVKQLEEKAVEKKSSEKPKDETKTIKKSKGNTNGESKPAKTNTKIKSNKIIKSNQTTESKNLEKAKLKSKKSKKRKSVNLVVRTALPSPKILKNTKRTAITSKRKNNIPAEIRAPNANTTVIVKTTGRGKKK